MNTCGMKETRGLCPACGVSVKPAARLCPNCGAELPAIWPPPPTQEQQPVMEHHSERLLTGQSWLDGLIGIGSCWLLAFVWDRYALYAINTFLRYNLSLGFNEHWLPQYLLDAAIAVPGLIIYPSVYFGMRAWSSKMARDFGQMSLWMVGILCILWPVFWLLR